MISSTKVPEAQRLQMLPKHWGRAMIVVESMVYDFTRQLCEAYDGGYWEFYELDNGGFYMAPVIEGKVKVSWADNYFSGEMSADALGIVACLFALSHMTFRVPSDQKIVDAFYQLRDYAGDHPEASLIFAAID